MTCLLGTLQILLLVASGLAVANETEKSRWELQENHHITNGNFDG